MKIAFVIRKGCQRCATIVKRIREILPPEWEIVYDKESATFLNVRGKDLEKIQADIIICIGGDGTVLRTLQASKGPVLGINMGGLGFLSEVEIGEVESTIFKLKRGEYSIEKSLKLKVIVNGVRLPDSTNEILVHSDKIAKIRRFSVSTSNNFIDLAVADGVLISTPVGSTSYSFSAGGPIIYPTLRAMVISYLAPFIARSRSMVIPPEEEIRVRIVGENQGCILIIDGQYQQEVSSSDDIRVTISENQAEFVMIGRSFFERMRDKLIKNVVD
ncbi:MAG: NAD(+) kinase [Candidatus Thermoplasmatota archaeon]|jgi:NAD+ kinase|nr:NAD(+) kinase [Candidatus Thermoplasmatota archaeon]